MQILAIETTGNAGTLALLNASDRGAEVLAEVRLEGRGRTAQSLAPSLKKLLSDAGWPPHSVELVAVAAGPGSFTGLRIGVTTAKTFAYAAGSAVIAVDTMEVLAHQAPPSNAPLWTILDAQRQELFAAKFGASTSDGRRQRLAPTVILPEQEFLNGVQPGGTITGPGVTRLRERLPNGITNAPESCWQPTAAAVGQVAWRAFIGGQRDDVWSVVPQYLRAIAAEEKRARSI